MTRTPDPMADLRDGFFIECAELLERFQDALADLELAVGDGRPADPETVNTAFRAVHSIKGGAGAFGLSTLVAIAHSIESLFDALREGLTALTVADVALLVRAADHLADLVAAGASGTDAPNAPPGIEACLAALVPIFRSGRMPDVEKGKAASDDSRPWQVAFRPQAALFASGNEPLFLL